MRRIVIAAVIATLLGGGFYLYQRMKQIEAAGKPRYMPLISDAR